MIKIDSNFSSGVVNMSFLRNNNHMLLIVVLAVTMTVLAPGLIAASNPKIRVTVGQSITQQFPNNVKTVSIADSDVADVVVAGPREVLVNGKAIGLTTVVVWDENSVSTMFDVVVRGPFSDQKIELRVQVAEVNRTKAAEYGFDYWAMTNVNDGSVEGALFGGPVATPQIPLAIFDDQAVEQATGAFRYLTGNSELQVMIKALETNGVIRVLAEPNVVAASGEKASFLAGGEIPVPIASAGTQGGTTVTIEWKEFGVKVSFIPTIVDSNIVNLVVEPEVSSLDYNNGIRISGFAIPAIRARRAYTTVELKDRETLVIGGLLMEEETEVVKRLPILGRIPILGFLFRDTQKIKNQNELMIVVSPHIVRALPPGVVVSLPTFEEKKDVEEDQETP
jgi:Flp pilus assembly secretin CpaC